MFKSANWWGATAFVGDAPAPAHKSNSVIPSFCLPILKYLFWGGRSQQSTHSWRSAICTSFISQLPGAGATGDTPAPAHTVNQIQRYHLYLSVCQSICFWGFQLTIGCLKFVKIVWVTNATDKGAENMFPLFGQILL